MGLGRSELIFTVYLPQDLPRAKRPRWAVLGRSNVGKSSLLNALTHPRQHFRVGAKPGVTRGLIGVKIYLGQSEKSSLEMVDLPGFGFALGAEKEAERWQQLAESVKADKSTSLQWLCLVDPKREPGVEDKQLLEWLEGESFALIFTKADRHKAAERGAIEKRWEVFCERSCHPPLWVSAVKPENLKGLKDWAQRFLRET